MSNNWTSIFVEVFCSHAEAELEPAGTTDLFADSPKSSAGRREMHDCTVDSLLGIHVTKAILQKFEVQFLNKSLKLSFLQNCFAHVHKTRVHIFF